MSKPAGPFVRKPSGSYDTEYQMRNLVDSLKRVNAIPALQDGATLAQVVTKVNAMLSALKSLTGGV